MRNEGIGAWASSGALLLLLAIVPAARGEDWPGFRGPRVDGVATEALLDTGSEAHFEVVWKRELGSGYSSISVVGDRLVTMFQEGDRTFLTALRAGSGDEEWRLEVGPAYPGHDGSHDGPIATPAIAVGRAFALGPWGRLVAADLESGELRWSTQLVDDLAVFKPFYGFGSSPLVVDGTVIVQLGGDPGSAVAGFDAATGERRWVSGFDRVGYQSPVPAEVDGHQLVVIAGSTKLFAMDPGSGEIVWEMEHEGSGGTGAESIVPVLTEGNRIFLASKDRSSTLWAMESVDSTSVGVPVWETGSIRNSYTVPVYKDGVLYAYSSRFLTAVDASTGEPMWKSRAPGDGFLTLTKDHLVILTKAGSLHFAKGGEGGYEELAGMDLFEDLAWTPPTVAHGSIYVRSLGEIARVEVRPGAPGRMADTDAGATAEGPLAGLLAAVAGASDRQTAVEAFLDAHDFPLVDDAGRVLFVYRGDAADVSIAGDMIGARLEEPMALLEGTDVYYWTTELAPGSGVSYSFVKDFEQQLDPHNPDTTMDSLFALEFELALSSPPIEMSELAMPGWVDPPDVHPAPEGHRGSFETHEFESEDVGGTANVQVYLPAGYGNYEKRYPVLYVHGGSQAMERGMIANSVDNLAGEIEPVITVFIDGQFSPRFPQQYLGWLTKTLVPFIDETYRTNPSREGRANLGASFFGYVAMMASFTYPETFGGVAGISPHMNDIMRKPLAEMVVDGRDRDLDLYIDWGTYDVRFPEEALDLVEVLRDFDELLSEHGYEPRSREIPRGAGWRWWRAANGDALRTLFPKR
jgi:enterochelin esterase-like enzyme/outer membrane protein assembly factor BamB